MPQVEFQSRSDGVSQYIYDPDRAFGNGNRVSIRFSSVGIQQDLAIFVSVMVNIFHTVQRVNEIKLRVKLSLQMLVQRK